MDLESTIIRSVEQKLIWTLDVWNRVLLETINLWENYKSQWIMPQEIESHGNDTIHILPFLCHLMTSLYFIHDI